MVSIIAAFISTAQPQAIQENVDLSVPQTECLTEAVYFESRGEGTVGNAAVSYVILNRAKQENESICDVIHERGQFSFYNPHREMRIHELEAWKNSAQVAVETQLGNIPNPIGNATYYNTVPVRSWRHVVFVAKIRHQYFYQSISLMQAPPLVSFQNASYIIATPLQPPVFPKHRYYRRSHFSTHTAHVRWRHHRYRHHER